MAEKTAEIKITTRPVRVEPSKVIQPRQELKAFEKVLRIPMRKVKKEEKVEYKTPEWLLPPKPLYIKEEPFIKPSKKGVILDIETTGINPWDSRLICIGLKDPSQPENPPTCIIDENEENVLRVFLEVFRQLGYNQIIGFNVLFDYRYIFAKCLFYRLPCKEFVDAELYDIQQILAKVKMEYVWGKVQPGTLEEWAEFLFGMKKPITYEELFELWKAKNFEAIELYNKNDVEMTFRLYNLIEYVKNNPIEPMTLTPPEEKKAEEELTYETEIYVRCPRCYSEWEVPPGTTTFTCPVCGEEIDVSKHMIQK